jgi:site-specific recombinase XerD
MAHACKAASLPDFTHHRLRHYFVSNAIEAGVDFKTIAAWVGHKDGGLLVAKTYGQLAYPFAPRFRAERMPGEHL